MTAGPDQAKPRQEPPAGGEGARWRWQFWVAASLLVGFAALVVAMILMADGDDGTWQRRVYVFGAVQALVFTAIGWLFGREVNRSAVVSAQAAADTAQQEAEAARDQAAHATSQTADATATLKAVRAAVRSSAPPARTGPRDVGAQTHRDGGVELRRFLDEFLGPEG